MNTKRLILTLCLLAILVMMAGCDKHYVDVYVNNQCALVSIDNDTAVIKPLLVFPGDYVIFNNVSGDSVHIDLPDGAFEKDLIHIAKNKRLILKVLKPETALGDIGISCDIGGSGAPTVVVGEEP